MSIVKLDLLHKKQFLKFLWTEVWKGGFQYMQILGLYIHINFDTVIVFVTNFSLLFQLALRQYCAKGFTLGSNI